MSYHTTDQAKGRQAKTTGAIITDIVEAYGGRAGQWVRIAEIAQQAGLTPAQVAQGIRELLHDDDFRAEPEPFGHRITAEDRLYGPVVGGEARHLIRWGE